MSESGGGPREIPIDYRRGNGAPVVTTTMKIIMFLISYTTALVVVIFFVFRFVVASEVKDLRIELAEGYAKKGDIIGAAAYHQEQARQDDRITRIEDDLRRIREQQDKNTGRLDRLEGSRR